MKGTPRHDQVRARHINLNPDLSFFHPSPLGHLFMLLTGAVGT